MEASLLPKNLCANFWLAVSLEVRNLFFFSRGIEMKTKLLLLLAFLFGCCFLTAQQEQIPNQGKKAAVKKTPSRKPAQEVDENGIAVPPKYICLSGASYTYPIWAERYPYPTGQSGFFANEPAVSYRRYKPTEAEAAAAEKVCAAQLQQYLENLGRAEQASFNEQDKSLYPDPPNKANEAKVFNCILLNPTCATWILRERQADIDVRVVFVHEGLRYTVATSFNSPEYPRKWLAIWVRPEGSKGTAAVDYFSAGLNGLVDSASDGKRQRIFRDLPSPSKKEGLEWRDYWQQRHNQAISKIVEYMTTHPAPKRPYWCTTDAKPVWPLTAPPHRQPGEYQEALQDCRKQAGK